MSRRSVNQLPSRLGVSTPGPVNFSGDTETPAQMIEDRAEIEHSTKVRSFVRDEWIRAQMSAKASEYTQVKNLNVFVGTWNVNGKKPSEPLRDWLCPDLKRRKSKSTLLDDLSIPDVYVLGFQEIVDLNRPSNVMSDSSSKERSDMWVERIHATLNKLSLEHSRTPDHKFVFLVERHLVGIMLCVFVKQKHAKYIPPNKVQTASVATGVMGIVGNKGAVSIRMQAYDSDICFICGHLAAHRENVDSRNSDYHNIMTKTSFKIKKDEWNQMSTEERLSASRMRYNLYNEDSSNATFGVKRHDFIIWLGDLNYRMSTLSSDEQVFEHVFAKDLDWLILNDQLNIERRAGHVFKDFCEAPLTFAPTYKYQTGTSTYDRRPEKKVRAPAWCDRILWQTVDHESTRYPQDLPSSRSPANVERSDRSGKMEIIEYNSRDSLQTSDHKPVVLDCIIQCKLVCAKKRHISFMNVMSLLDKWENDAVPKLSLQPSSIEFAGGVKYKVPCSQTIRLSNSSRVPATWRFVPKLEELKDRKVCKNWLTLEPEYGMLLPGESVNVAISGYINTSIARDVIAHLETLNDILLLRVEKGTDYYIPISADMLPTCFGASLTNLCRTLYPYQATKAEKEAFAMQQTGLNIPSKLPYPKELWRLFNFLWLYGGIHERGIFQLTLNASAHIRDLKAFEKERVTIRTCLDTGFEIPPPPTCSVHAVAATVIELIQSMPMPIVPFEFFPRVDFETVEVARYCKNFLNQLPLLNQNVFVHIVSFLRELLLEENRMYNRLSAESLSSIFAECLLRPAEVPLSNRPQGSSSGGFDFPQWLTGGDSSSQKRKSCHIQAKNLIYHMISAGNIF